MGDIVNLKRGMLVLIVSILLVNIAYSYPIIISESPINHTEVKQLVYSIPEHYFKYVDIIEFVNKPIEKYNWLNNYEAEINYYGGWYWIYWDNNHNCYNGKIIIYDFKYIVHELGHIDWNCNLKQSTINEEYAHNFNVK